MYKSARSLVAAAVVGMATPMAASAANYTVFDWAGCGGQSFASCATVTATYDNISRILQFSVTNSNAVPGWEGAFTGVGWLGLGNTGLTALDMPTGWSFAPNNQQGLSGPLGGQAEWFTWVDPGNGITPPNTASFQIKFMFTPSFSNFTFGLRETGFGTQVGGDCGTSNRLHVNQAGASGSNGSFTEGTYTESLNREGGANCYNFPAGDEPPPNAFAAPEPATMVLLATGLLGLAGAQLRRRKTTKV